MFIHLTLVPYIGHAGELKTKPTQHSVNELRRIGIAPDMLLCRSESELALDIRRKIALFASLGVEAVISAKDVDNIYKVPLWFHEQGVDDFIVEHFGLRRAEPADLDEWRDITRRADEAAQPVRIALVGKYVQLEDAYLSVSRGAAPLRLPARRRSIEIDWVDSETLDADEERRARGSATPTASSSPAASAAAASRARSARSRSRASGASRTSASAWACRSPSASSPATSPACRARTRPSSTSRREWPVIDLLPEQKEVSDLGGTMRLGADPIKLHPDTQARELYDEAVVYERHRHRYEVSITLRKRLEAAGLVVSGTSPDERLVEIDRAARPPVLRRLAVPPRVQVAPGAPRPAVPRLRRRGAAARARARSPRASRSSNAPSSVTRWRCPLVRPASEVERRRLNESFAALCAIASPSRRERAVADHVAGRAARARARGRGGRRGRGDRR